MTPNRRDPNSPLVAVGLFSGAGGLDLGLEQAGWTVAAQMDFDRDCALTLELAAQQQRTPPLVLHAAIEDVSPANLRERLGLARGELPLLAGGPPCQPFTTSGLRRGINDARANSLFPAYLEYLDEFNPTALLIENVDGLLSAAQRHRPLAQRGKEHPPLAPEEQKGSFLRWFLDELTARGYSVSWGVAEAADYGVAQMRQRALIIGVKGDEPCFLPPPTHGGSGQPSFRTLKDALGDLEEVGDVQPLSERKRQVYELIPPGGNWRNLSEEQQRATMGRAFNAEGGKSGWWRRLAWDAPAPTVLGMPDHSSTALIHPDETRCLSVYECAAVQSFPASVRFAGTARSQYQQIGNAVPVLLAKAVGEHIAQFLAGERLAEPPPPNWRRSSANRRIGTHGWAIPKSGEIRFTINVKIRPDHVWAHAVDVEKRA